METTTLQPLGAEVSGVRIGELTAEDVAALKLLLAEHGVLVLRGQHADDETFLGFLRGFGELAFTPGEIPVEGSPDLNLISNVGRAEPPRSTFHVDSSYLGSPPAYTALRAVQIPSRGGQTVFTDQYRAFETLPADVVARLEGRSITHVVTGLDLGPDDETQAEHPVLRPHPLSGRTALYLSTPKRCAAVSGMADDEAAELVAYLYGHSTAEENCHRHSWAPGDVVIWDNGCVLHRGDHADVVGDRVMHRGMVAASGYGRRG